MDPRIAPLTDDELTDEQAALLAPLGRSGRLHVFRTLVRHPTVFKAWMRFSGPLLMKSSFPDDLRELVILRVAHRVGSTYEWAQHVPMGTTAGLSDGDIAALTLDDIAEDDVADWDPTWLTVVHAVDELLGDGAVAASTWASLSETFSPEELIELTMLAGHYQMLAGTLASLGVQVEAS